MGQNNPSRSTSDNEQNNRHPHTHSEGRSAGNMGAGKSGKEGLGTEKKVDDERFGSQQPGASRMNKPA